MAKKIRVWDGTAWQDVAPSLPYTAIHSAQASMPLTGVDGQVWLDTDGTLAGQDFVPLSGGTMTGNLNVPSINSGGISGQNHVINGGFDIWQRGTSFTNPGASYTADRWITYFPYNGTLTQETSVVPTGFRYAAKVTASTTDTGGRDLYQLIETANTIPLAGKTVTVSAWVTSTAGKRQTIALTSSTTVDDSLYNVGTNVGAADNVTAIAGTFQQVKFTATIPSNAKTLRIGLQANDSYSSGNYIIWGGVQLEVGSQATPFSRAGGTIAGELSACQRYYYRIYNPNGGQYNAFALTGVNSSTTTAGVQINFPVKMRIKPSALEYANVGWYVYRTGGNFQGGTWSLNTSAHESAYILYTTSGLVVNDAGIMNQNVAGVDTSYIAFSAEL
jgi:hypothetical protein